VRAPVGGSAHRGSASDPLHMFSVGKGRC